MIVLASYTLNFLHPGYLLADIIAAERKAKSADKNSLPLSYMEGQEDSERLVDSRKHSMISWKSWVPKLRSILHGSLDSLCTLFSQHGRFRYFHNQFLTDIVLTLTVIASHITNRYFCSHGLGAHYSQFSALDSAELFSHKSLLSENCIQ